MSTNSPEPENFAPQMSTDIAMLALSVAAAKIDSEQFRDLLWLLNAPPDLSDLQHVLTVFNHVLDRAEAEWPGILNYQGLDQLPQLLKQLLVVIPSVQFSHGWNRDWVSRNALYCALRHTLSPTQPLLHEYSLLQAHFFFAHSAYLISHTSRQGYESYGGSDEWPALKIDAYRAGLCIRDMAEKKHSDWASEFLEKSPVHLSPRDFPAKSSVAMESERKHFSVQKKVNYVSDYLCQVYGIKERGKGHGSSPRTPNWGLDSAIGDRDDPALNFGVLADWEVAFDLVKDPVNPLILPISNVAEPHQSAPSESSEENGEDQNAGSDECPYESEAEKFLGGYECQDEQYEKSTGSFEGHVHVAANQIIRKQKMFRFGIERLCGTELAGLGDVAHFTVEQLLSKQWLNNVTPGSYRRADLPIKGLEEAEGIMFLMVMLWTGSTPERAMELFVHSDYGSNAGELSDYKEFALTDDAFDRRMAFRIAVPFPDYQTIQKANPDSDCKRVQHVLLHDYALVACGISHLRSRYRQRLGNYLFQKPPEYYKARAQALLKGWDPSGRLTLKKISSIMFDKVMSVSGNDSVAATMITGQRHRLSDVPMYYACRNMAYIRDIYKRACEDLLSEIRWDDFTDPYTYHELRRPQAESSENDASSDEEDAEQPGKEANEEPDKEVTYEQKERARQRSINESTYIGARLCPRRDSFRKAILELKSSLHKPYKPSPDKDWIEFHNLYTFYTVWLFNIAVGSRKLITPYVDVKEVSPLNGVAIYRDKDGDTGAKAKLIWIPPLVVKQMWHYEAHIRYISSRFSRDGEPLPCFLLNQEKRALLVRPSSLNQYVARYLPGFQGDIHRRFIFNVLLDSGCPPEVTRIWMGHACAGEEWWSESATFSHFRYRQRLGEYLVPILEDLGFEPIAGATPDRDGHEAKRA